MLDLRSQAFYDKIYGCWMGKNSGGTLGAPLERGFGDPEPFDVWWYPELREGGIPNDDLEMQLIWLKALEEVGPALKAIDLAHYWLNHIGYNWDEYGLNKTNLRLGLQPPISGYYNNWFKDCMGCPIRSEIWACIAPGHPRIAVRYAYEDAICDHAGGESVYGELFNTAVESAAFVISNREELINIGLSYIPSTSQTTKAIQAARQAYADGDDWKTARKRVLEATPHYNAQYSPINLGFQVLGWLYGEDFADTICKTVNCGYDTDCTGATVGSIIGIIDGRQGLPQKWIEPLGENISTNESWGGLHHASDGPNPVPTNLTDLTNRVITQAIRVLTAHGVLTGDSTISVDPAQLYADESIQELWQASPTRVDFPNGTLKVSVEYNDSPAVIPGEQKQLTFTVKNPQLTDLMAYCQLKTPEGWTASLIEPVMVSAGKSVTLNVQVTVPAVDKVQNSNLCTFAVSVPGYIAQPEVPVVLLGAYRYQHSAFYAADGRSEQELFAEQLEPERVSDNEVILSEEGRPGTWHTFYARENELPLQEAFPGAGVLYVRSYIWNPDESMKILLGAPATCPLKLWVNSQQVLEAFHYTPLRPNYGGDGKHYIKTTFQHGWNELLVKFVQGEDAPPFAAHIVLSNPDDHDAGLYRPGRTRAPWEVF